MSPQKTSKLQKALLGVAALLLVAVGVLYFIGRGRVEEAIEPAVPAPEVGDRLLLESVTLYFGSAERVGLVRETRAIPSGSTLKDRIRKCIRELAGGSFEGHLPVLPPKTRLRSVYLDPWGLAYLDFDRALLGGRSPGDGEEWLAVAAVVRTVCDNFAEVREVRFMVDGHMVVSIGGYIDLEEPLRAADFPLGE